LPVIKRGTSLFLQHHADIVCLTHNNSFPILPATKSEFYQSIMQINISQVSPP
jgi:hypothetical protein